jgi:hypothetical protein
MKSNLIYYIIDENKLEFNKFQFVAKLNKF